MFDNYEMTGKQDPNDPDLKAAALENRLYAYGIWCGLFILQEDFFEPFILCLARDNRMTHPFNKGLEMLGLASFLKSGGDKLNKIFLNPRLSLSHF